MTRYVMTLEIESDSDPRDWLYTDRLIIDGEYQVLDIEEVEA
jgi:hypothetical protein